MRICLYFLLIFSLLFSAGCYSLRKKFIRKKDKSENIPVCVNFKEYSNGNAIDAYRDYAVFFRAWISEAITVLKDNGNRKRVRYSIDEAVDDIDGMIGLCHGELKVKLESFRERLLAARQRYSDAFSQVGRYNYIYSLEAIKKEFDAEFSLNDVKEMI